MTQMVFQGRSFRFDNFYLDPQNRQLWRNDELLPLNSRYFDALLLLVTHSGQLVEKQRIFDEVWSGVFVSDAALTQCIKDIRRQLGDSASNPRYIKTVPKHGYIFIGNTVTHYAELLSAANSAAAEDDSSPSDFAPAPVPARPYKFLDYFTEKDALLFFGRESEVSAISSQILARRSFVLHGRSGVGKSSILRAGLMPRLKADGHMVFVIRSFTDPVHQMEVALSDALASRSQGEVSSLRDLLDQAARQSPGRTVVFFLDQFEEFFSMLAEETRQNFIQTVSKLVADEALPLRLVFALREDLFAEMSQLKPAIPEIFHHEYRLKRLSRGQAAQAITGPASAVGCKYEAALVDRLLDDLGDPNGIDPPQLQIVCDNLYDCRGTDSTLTVDTYERLGTASQILAGYLDRVLRRFNANDFQVSKEILMALVSAEGERAILRESEMGGRVRTSRSQGPAAIARLVEDLVAARIVRRRSQDGEAWVELAHEFLMHEVSGWLTADETRLKRARGIIERAVENYRAHKLTIGTDAVDLLLPFGEGLTLTGEEADLLVVSILASAQAVPEWLIRISPSANELIADAAHSADSRLRLQSVDACRFAPSEQTKTLLTKLALWDADLTVRKSASIALADWLGTEAEEILSSPGATNNAGPIRRAISLAMIRDYDKSLVRLSRHSLAVGLLVILGLIWVRLRREGAEIIQQGIGGTVGGAVSGLVGGVLLAAGLAMARQASILDATSLMLVLVSLGVFIGAIGGFGVSTAMVVASRIAYRHSRWWSVVGAAAGGALIGGSSKLLGMDTVKALFGQSPNGITGAFEGAAVGASVALGAVLTSKLLAGARPWQKALGAGLGAMCAGIMLTVIGGNLFSASLEIVARSFADSQIRMEPLAPYFGEVQFGQTTRIFLGAIEGLLFGTGMTAGMGAGFRVPGVGEGAGSQVPGAGAEARD